jgi:hypothetical protein
VFAITGIRVFDGRHFKLLRACTGGKTSQDGLESISLISGRSASLSGCRDKRRHDGSEYALT